MQNVLLKLSFDGTTYHGWQIQENAVTVQEVFQQALFEVLGERPDIKACSRTDSGVHAREFAVSLMHEKEISPQRLKAALNHYLPEDIAVLSTENMPQDFHARYSCKGKEYCYEILNREVRDPFLRGRALHYWYRIDEELLSRAAENFVGKHDFTSFCTKDARASGDMERTVLNAEVFRCGDVVVFRVSADGFLYNMVRIMTGTLLRVQQGKLKPEDIPLIIEKRDRKAAGPTAPACGLYLNRVMY